MRASGKLTPVAVTFSGDFEPATAGWHVFRVEAIGQAALYVDGLQRLKIEGNQGKATQIYLSDRPHELIVRYMSDGPVRQLSVSVALRDGPATPLSAGLSSGACR
jgi:hypothetical protein